MSRLDDYILWKSSLAGGADLLGPERALLVSAPALPNKGTRYAVVGRHPDVPSASFSNTAFNGRPALFILSDAEDLTAEKWLPRAECLFSPRSSELTLQALVSSSAVVSFSLLPAVVAIGHRIPAVVISEEPHTMLLADRLGIPCLKPARASELIPALAELWASHRWEIAFLGAELLKQKLPPVKTCVAKPVSAREMTVALIADEKFLPHLNGLVHNLKEVGCVSFRFEILALDEATEDFVASLDANVSLYRFRDLWKGTDPKVLETWPTVDKAFRSKPKFLLRLVRANRGAVFYFDTDLLFMRCPSSLMEEFGAADSSLLLFPNWNDLPDETKRWGLFNAGLLGVRPGCERFLEVWTSLCQTNYRTDDGGYIWDQGFLDLVPLYQERFTVYRRGDENVARWNQMTREEGLPVRSFHASQPDVCGFYEQKMAWDQALWAFTDPANRYAVGSRWAKVLSNSWSDHVLPLSRFLGFARVVRRVFQMPGLDSPRAAKFFMYGPGRALLGAGAILRRYILPEHRIEKVKGTSPWIAQQQLAIRESSSARKGFLPSILPFELSDLAVRESMPLATRPLEIH